MNGRRINLIRIILDRDYRFCYFESKGFFKRVGDEDIIKRCYEIKLGKEPNLDDPRTFCEKIQWLKLYDRKLSYSKLADKYEVKKWVEDRIGSRHVVKSYGVWKAVDQIEYYLLPQKFVIKCTHDPGSVFCCDKYETNFKKLKRQMRKSFATNVYWTGNGRNWVYKDITPRIMAEEYIPELYENNTREYRVICFNGKAELITVNNDSLKTTAYYDRDWNRLPFCVNDEMSGMSDPIPSFLNELIHCSETLAKDIPVVRVDGYIIDGRYLFNGVEFYPWNGFANFKPEEWDVILGDKIDLSSVLESKVIPFPGKEYKPFNS